jgi:hypothetical protein
MFFLVVGTPWKTPRSSRLAVPIAVMAGSAAYPLPAPQHSECDCEILVGRVERLLDYLDEMFALHPSPSEINKGTLTPSSRRLRRHHRHLLCPRLRLPLRLLPRLAPVGGEHRQLPTDQEFVDRGFLDVFRSYSMLRHVAFGNVGSMGGTLRGSKFMRILKAGIDFVLVFGAGLVLGTFAHCGLSRGPGREWPNRSEGTSLPETQCSGAVYDVMLGVFAIMPHLAARR